MAKGFQDCPYCTYTAASDAQLKHHINKFHESLLALEGEKAHNKVPQQGFNYHSCDQVVGYLHQSDDGKRGKVALVEILGDEGITREWRCFHCQKLLKTWFTEWTPEAKENRRLLKEQKTAGYVLTAKYKEMTQGIGRLL